MVRGTSDARVRSVRLPSPKRAHSHQPYSSSFVYMVVLLRITVAWAGTEELTLQPPYDHQGNEVLGKGDRPTLVCSRAKRLDMDGYRAIRSSWCQRHLHTIPHRQGQRELCYESVVIFFWRRYYCSATLTNSEYFSGSRLSIDLNDCKSRMVV